MAARTIESPSERLGQHEARLVQIDESQNKLRGSTDYEDCRQRASLMLEREEIETELPQLRSAADLEQAKAQNRMQGCRADQFGINQLALPGLYSSNSKRCANTCWIVATSSVSSTGFNRNASIPSAWAWDASMV